MVVMKKGGQGGKKNLLPWQTMGISGGAVFAMQPPMNSNGIFIRGLRCTDVFPSATLMLYAIVLMRKSDRTHLPQVFSTDRPWWSWLGGIIGGTFVMGFAFFAAKVGVGLLLVTSICGLLTCSLVTDKYGMLGAEKKPVGMVQYIGMLCVLSGIAVLRLNQS